MEPIFKPKRYPPKKMDPEAKKWTKKGIQKPPTFNMSFKQKICQSTKKNWQKNASIVNC